MNRNESAVDTFSLNSQKRLILLWGTMTTCLLITLFRLWRTIHSQFIIYQFVVIFFAFITLVPLSYLCLSTMCFYVYIFMLQHGQYCSIDAIKAETLVYVCISSILANSKLHTLYGQKYVGNLLIIKFRCLIHTYCKQVDNIRHTAISLDLGYHLSCKPVHENSDLLDLSSQLHWQLLWSGSS